MPELVREHPYETHMVSELIDIDGYPAFIAHIQPLIEFRSHKVVAIIPVYSGIGLLCKHIDFGDKSIHLARKRIEQETLGIKCFLQALERFLLLCYLLILSRRRPAPP